MTYLQGFCESQGENQPVKTDESSVIFSQIPLPTPKIKNNRNQMVAVVLEWESHFCLIITLCCVKGYSAFHIFSTADAVPEKIVHSRLHSRFLLCKNRCCDEPCFAARNRFVNSFTRPKSKNSPLSRTVFFSSMFPFLPCYNFI